MPELSALARGLVERVGDGGWARQLPADLLASDLRPMLFTRMAALAGTASRSPVPLRGCCSTAT